MSTPHRASPELQGGAAPHRGPAPPPTAEVCGLQAEDRWQSGSGTLASGRGGRLTLIRVSSCSPQVMTPSAPRGVIPELFHLNPPSLGDSRGQCPSTAVLSTRLCKDCVSPDGGLANCPRRPGWWAVAGRRSPLWTSAWGAVLLQSPRPPLTVPHLWAPGALSWLRGCIRVLPGKWDRSEWSSWRRPLRKASAASPTASHRWLSPGLCLPFTPATESPLLTWGGEEPRSWGHWSWMLRSGCAGTRWVLVSGGGPAGTPVPSVSTPPRQTGRDGVCSQGDFRSGPLGTDAPPGPV